MGALNERLGLHKDTYYIDAQLRSSFPIGPNFIMDHVLG